MPGSEIWWRDIADRLHKELGLPRQRVRRVVESFFSFHIDRRAIHQQETILRGFGAFILNRRGKMFLKRRKIAKKQIERFKERNKHNKQKGL